MDQEQPSEKQRGREKFIVSQSSWDTKEKINLDETTEGIYVKITLLGYNSFISGSALVVAPSTHSQILVALVIKTRNSLL